MADLPTSKLTPNSLMHLAGGIHPPIAVAYSGGADSTALLLMLARQHPGQVQAIHIHHGLQAAADDFAAHCLAFCAALGVPLHVVRVNANAATGQSPEDAARRVRYTALSGKVRDINEALDQQIHARAAMINIAADEATKILGLSADEFLPYAAIWPRVRDGYLDWLAAHEASGATYVEGEVWKDMPLGKLTLVGKIDRIDQMPDGSRVVMDYKTEPASTTKDRIKAAGEDTQLAFYAALLHDDTLAAAYVNLGEKEPTKTYAQPEIVELRDELIGGILSDMERIAVGVPLPALGEGKACDYCSARGLCRKDFWS
jgi:RecB family exonuclease